MSAGISKALQSLPSTGVNAPCIGLPKAIPVHPKVVAERKPGQETVVSSPTNAMCAGLPKVAPVRQKEVVERKPSQQPVVFTASEYDFDALPIGRNPDPIVRKYEAMLAKHAKGGPGIGSHEFSDWCEAYKFMRFRRLYAISPDKVPVEVVMQLDLLDDYQRQQQL